EAVHDGAEHAHVVGAGAVHATLLHLGSPEAVPSAHHDADADAGAHDLGDLLGDLGDDVRIDADLPPSEDFTRELEQYAVVGGHAGSFRVDHWWSRREEAGSKITA